MTDDLVKRPDDEQDDLTLVYMWAYKMAEKKYKSRIEQLERLLEQRDAFIVKNDLWHDFVATLKEKTDAPST
jgi:hypothetical protein